MGVALARDSDVALEAKERFDQPRGTELRLVHGGRCPVPAADPLRLTPFARLLLCLTVAGVTALLLLRPSPSPESTATRVDHKVTVSAGESLSEIALAELPRLSGDEGVAQIQLANRMSSSDVHAGQRLDIPHVG